MAKYVLFDLEQLKRYVNKIEDEAYNEGLDEGRDAGFEDGVEEGKANAISELL